MKNTVELLAPARNTDIGRAAILAGADAVYIGAELFGARKDAANSVDSIAGLCSFAHRYGAKIYAALNTILTDTQLSAAQDLAWRLYNAGVDALIIQDFGLAGSDLPPIPIHASTQCHIDSVEKALLAQAAGFSTIVPARELSLDEIANISKNVSANIECFVHGALCVSYSGQCYLSYAIGSRSGNRGECAQPCRMKYMLKNSRGECPLGGKERHWLSLKDMDRHEFLKDMIQAGVRSFKIEGRLKDASYVKNVVAFYSQALDKAISGTSLARSSAGISKAPFEPDLQKTFSRGFTPYHILGTQSSCASFDSPKSKGKFLFKTKRASRGQIEYGKETPLAAGDGLFIEPPGGAEPFGVRVQSAKDGTAKLGFGTPAPNIPANSSVWRNLDANFEKLLEADCARKIPVEISVDETNDAYIFKMQTPFCGELAISSESIPKDKVEVAGNKNLAKARIEDALSKLGDTEFVLAGINTDAIEHNTPFFKLSEINAVRRNLVEKLRLSILKIFNLRKSSYKRPEPLRLSDCVLRAIPNDWRANVLNEKARQFYNQLGVEITQPAPESGKIPMQGLKVMKTKHCILRELGMCKKKVSNKNLREPLYLESKECVLKVSFDCSRCGMDIYFVKRK